MNAEYLDAIGVIRAAIYELQEDEFDPEYRRPMTEVHAAVVALVKAHKELIAELDRVDPQWPGSPMRERCSTALAPFHPEDDCEDDSDEGERGEDEGGAS